MATVIRVKRRLEEEPSTNIILNCKRRKVDPESEQNENSISTAFKFVRTLQSQEENVSVPLKKSTKEEIERQFKKPNIDIINKLRVQNQQDSKNNRFKIVSCYRSLNSDNKESTADSELVIYDIESGIHSDHSDDQKEKFVYDLYYTTSSHLEEADIEEYVSMYSYGNEPAFFSAQNKDYSSDSDDSNAENNLFNQYPDESDADSVTDEDMVNAMGKMGIDNLSSDDCDCHDYESEEYNDEETDEEELGMHRNYVRFKTETKKNKQKPCFSGDLYIGDIDESEYFY